MRKLVAGFLVLAVFAALLIFRSNFFLQKVGNNRKSQSSKSKQIELVIAGDVMLGRTVMTRSLDMGDPVYPFRKIAPTLKAADIAFVNLENPVISNCPRFADGFKFCTDPKMIDGLLYAGVDVVTIANNHIRNFGESGVGETRDFLARSGIEATGLKNLVIKEVNGVKFGFIGFDFVTYKPTPEDYQLVAESNSKVNILIVAPHWGTEYTSSPNKFQKETGRKLVALGADLIVGSHPHWVQGWEYVDGVPVFWSLGNLVFDQMWSQETRRGLVVRIKFDEKKILGIEELPIYMKNWAQPELVGEDKLN